MFKIIREDGTEELRENPDNVQKECQHQKEGGVNKLVKEHMYELPYKKLCIIEKALGLMSPEEQKALADKIIKEVIEESSQIIVDKMLKVFLKE